MISLFAKRASVGGFALGLAVSLAACGGGAAGTGGAVVPSQSNSVTSIPVETAGSTYSLGFVRADRRTIESMPQFRQVESAPALPAIVDLSAKMPPVGNQGHEGSCVSWASAYAMRGYEARRDVWSSIVPSSTDPTKNFSPAFTYNQVNGGHDSGSTIPAVLTVLQQKGAATLADMPYVDGQYKTQPSISALADALNYKLGTYGYIAPTNYTAMKTQLAAGIPVILAIKVYNNFFSLKYNTVYSAVSGGVAGGHAITIVGYDDTKKAFKIQNSWSTGWATAGFGWIAYSVMPAIALEAYSAVDSLGAPAK